MDITKARVVIFSPCGGTANVANALASGLSRSNGMPVIRHDLTAAKNRGQKVACSPDELVILAFPVYGGRMPRNVANVLADIDGNEAPCVLVAVYGNRAYEGALLDLREAALARGFAPVAAVAAVAEHSLAPTVATARPDAADRETLAGFAERILARASNGHTLSAAPGAMPSWERPKGTSFFPITNLEKCVACGHCADICATGAIDAKAPEKTDTEKCAVCGACAKHCPQGARVMGDEATRVHFRPHLETAATRRKDPELFF